jgi:hypothetical protein
VWASPAGAGALVVLALTALVRGVLLSGSFFNQDDYYLTSRAAHASLSWSFLFAPTAGHVQPAQQLTYWVVARIAGFRWPVVAAGILAVQLIALVLTWLVLSRLLPRRLVRLPLLAVVAWSPLTLVTTLWWSAAMGLWPGVAAAMAALLALLQPGPVRRLPWTRVLACWAAVVFALTWHERGILIPALLFGVAVAMSPGPGARRVVQAFSSHVVLWSGFIVGSVAYVVLHTRLTRVGGQGADLSTYIGIVWNALARNAVPGLASGPWAARVQGGAIVPATTDVIVSAALALGLALVLLLRGGARARWAMAMLGAYWVVTVSMLLLGRAGFGTIIGFDTRYTADLVVIVVFLAVALRDVRLVPPRRWWSSRTPLLAGLVLATYGAGTLLGNAVQVPQFQNRQDRAYFTNLRSDYDSDPGQVIIDAPVPGGILLPLLGRETLLSNVLRPLPEHVTFDEASSRLRVVDAKGHLHPPQFAVGTTMRPGDPPCGYAVSSSPTRVPLEAAVTGEVVVRIGYYTNQESDVRVWDGGFSERFRAQPGPNVVWLVVPDQSRPITGWWLSQQEKGAGAICVAQLEAGAVRR